MKNRVFAFALSVCLLMGLLTGCAGGSQSAAAEPTAEPATAAPTAEPTAAPTAEPAPTAETDSKVASGADTIEAEEVVEEGMHPITAESIREGVYPVEMKSSSAMFKADHCELAVSDGKMQAILYMTSESYLYMFAGTAQEAAAADESAYIPLEETGTEGLRKFVLPLGALDDGESFAAFSRKKELWYGRTLLFRADSLPLEAFVEGYLVTAESLGLADGEYTVDVTLSGGSGKAAVHSPARLFVKDGKATAEIIWGSSNYDFMIVGGEKIDPETLEGGSTFLVDVAAFDHPIGVQADTIAMSTPHLIDYALRFDSASIQSAK